LYIPAVKAAKVFTFRDRYHLEANFQLFNVLNNSSAVATNYLTGPTTYRIGLMFGISMPGFKTVTGYFHLELNEIGALSYVTTVTGRSA
jgi:hypothetical protein